MPVEKSAGAVVFRKNKKIKYLLLHYPSTAKAPKEYWDFPKGHIEKGEDELITVQREVQEETGLKNLQFIDGFKELIRYFFKFQGKTIFKIVTFYLVKTKEKRVKISLEHLGYKWLSYKEALSKLTFKNAKEILQKANEFLSREGLPSS